jgi:hypothetical protein
MWQESFLAGKVLKSELPVIEGKPGPGVPNLKRLMLPQGELAQIHNSDEGIRYMAVIELCLDSLRGNHFHKVKNELIYVIEGELAITVEDIKSKEQALVVLLEGGLVRIQTEVAHVLRTVMPGRAIEYSSAIFDPADIVPWNFSSPKA